MQRTYQRLERRNDGRHVRPFAPSQCICRGREAPKPSRASGQQQGAAPRRGFDAKPTRVVWVHATAGESGALEAIHQARHRGRTHALGARERTEGLGPAEREDGERGEEGGADPRANVLDLHPAQQRDGQPVELVELHGDAGHGGAAPGCARGGLRGGLPGGLRATGGYHRIVSNTN